MLLVALEDLEPCLQQALQLGIAGRRNQQGLERAGIPHLLVEFEEKMWTFERTRNEIETFVESMLFD